MAVRGVSRRLVAGLAGLALVAGAAACSDDGGDEPEASGDEGAAPAGTPQLPAEIAEGCGSQAVTDPADLDAGRVVARCGADAPAAEPLAAPATVRVAVPDPVPPELAPIVVADAAGEFEAENLTVELVPLDDRAAMEALDAGDVDLAAGPVGAAFLDALDRGSGARWILGGVIATAPNDTSRGQTGLWVRDNALGAEGLSDLELQPVGVPGAVRSAAVYPIELTLTPADLTLNETALTDVGGFPAAQRLLDGELAAAWLDGGSWHPVAATEGFHLAGTLPAAESLDGTVASPRLLGPDRAVGLAYVRAIQRTINTHLTGDYRDDDEVMAPLAEATGIEQATLASLPAELFDWEVREGTLERVEASLLELGGTSYDEPLASDRFVDRTLASEAVGAT